MTAASLSADPRAVERSAFGDFAGLLHSLRGWLPSSRAEVLPGADTKAREAEELRQMARGYQRDEPSFAADLFAAADRHERC